MIVFNSLYTIVLTSSSTNNKNNRIDPIVRSLKRIVDTALEDDSSDDINNDLLIKQLSEILEQEEGFRLVDRKKRSLYPTFNDDKNKFDGSGEPFDDDIPPFYSNMSIVAFTMGTTTTAFAQYSSRTYPPCQCEKGERGDKGEAGICPADCSWRYSSTYTQECLGQRINLEHLAQSIRQLIVDTKKIAYRNARAVPCVCTAPPSPPTTTTVSSLSNQFVFDYNMYSRLKGEKGDRGETGTSCSPTCGRTAQTNVRVFSTIKEAMEASYSYSDHTYVHIVNEHKRLQGVFIRIFGQLIPIRLESDHPIVIHETILPPTSISIPRPQCTITLPCATLHLFALGPNVRQMCQKNRFSKLCSKLSDYDEICERESDRNKLKGFYRAFMSTSTQWLSNLFDGICVSARILNMHEQVLFNRVDDMFQQYMPQSEILDVQGLRPQFQYWWHGSFVNGTASNDTCLDWSRYNSSLSGVASRLSNEKIGGLFYPQYTWPCSVGESNMGILCIETNCDKTNYQKH